MLMRQRQEVQEMLYALAANQSPKVLSDIVDDKMERLTQHYLDFYLERLVQLPESASLIVTLTDIPTSWR